MVRRLQNTQVTESKDKGGSFTHRLASRLCHGLVHVRRQEGGVEVSNRWLLLEII